MQRKFDRSFTQRLMSSIAAVSLASMVTAPVLSLPSAPLTGISPAYSQNDDLSRVQTLADAGDYQAAIKLIKSIEATYSKNIDYYILAAQIFLQSANGEDAVNYVIKARNAGANYDRTALLLAKAFLVQQRYKMALDAVKDAKFLENELYDAALIQADARLSLGERDKAEMLYRQAMNRDKSRYEAYLGLSKMALQVRNVTDAEGFAALALKQAPTETMVHYTMGLVQRYRGNFTVAKSHFDKAIELFSANSLARLERASILINANDIEAAEKDLDVVYSYSPNNQMAFYLSAVILARQGKAHEADLLLEKAQDLVKRYLPAAYIKGVVAYERGSYPIAEVYLKHVLKAKPQNIQLTRLLAITYLKQQKYKQARLLLAPYMKTPSGQKDAVALNLAGVAEIGVGDVKAGLAYYEMAIAAGGSGVTPGSKDPIAEIQSKLALAKYAAGQVDAAFDSFEKSAVSGSVRDLALLATVYLRENKIVEARMKAQELIARHSERAIGYNIMGTVLMAQKRYAEAIIQFKEAIKRNPDYVTAQRNIGLCYLEQKLYPEAETYLQKVAEKVTNDYRLNSLLGKSLYEQQKYKEAIPLFRIAFRELKNAPELTVDFANALVRTGKSEEAMQVAQKGVLTYANKPEILKALGLVLMQTGDVLRATQVFSRVVSFQSQDIESQLLYARSLTKAKLYAGARSSYAKIQSITASRQIKVPGLAWYQAELEFDAGRLDRVELLLPSLKENDRPEAVPAYLFGAILNRFKRYTEAEVYLEARYMALKDDFTILDHLITSKMAQHKEQDSINLLQDFIGRHKTNLKPRIRLAEVYKSQGQIERAINSYQAVFDMGIIDATISSKLARLLLDRDPYKAETMARYAIDILPNDPYSLSTYGLYLLEVKKDAIQSLTYFKKAIARAPAVAENHYFMGLAYRRMNARDDALKALQAALNLSTDFDGAAEAARLVNLLK